MKYNQPFDQPSSPNAPYIDGSPQAGIQGSIVPAASIEFDQREVVEVITRANARGYVDFSGTPCAVPGNQDLTQLRKAIEGFITNWSFIIDTTITFKVHGTGYDFVDLNAAMAYLRKYYITPRGHVILQCAGAVSPTPTAVQYTYNSQIIFSHPNNNRISVFGAPMLAPVPVTDSGYASNGSSVPTRAGDTQANLNMLRTKFATEFHFQGPNGIIVGMSCPNLMHLDGLLLTSDGNPLASGVSWVNSYGIMNFDTNMGVAAVGFGGVGFYMELAASIGTAGPGNSENTLCPLISIGNNAAGMALGDGSYFTMSGNLLAFNGGNYGLQIWPRGGVQMDGGVHCGSNGSHGVNMLLSSTCWIGGPMSGGSAYMPSHLWRNGGYGLCAQFGWADAYVDCGASTPNANTTGSIYVSQGGNVHPNAGDQHISGACSPAYGTVGNGNAYLG